MVPVDHLWPQTARGEGTLYSGSYGGGGGGGGDGGFPERGHFFQVFKGELIYQFCKRLGGLELRVCERGTISIVLYFCIKLCLKMGLSLWAELHCIDLCLVLTPLPCPLGRNSPYLTFRNAHRNF